MCHLTSKRFQTIDMWYNCVAGKRDDQFGMLSAEAASLCEILLHLRPQHNFLIKQILQPHLKKKRCL